MTEKTPKIIDDVDSIYEGIQRVRREKAAEFQMVLEEKTEQPVDTGMFACLGGVVAFETPYGVARFTVEEMTSSSYRVYSGVGAERIDLGEFPAYPAEDGLLHGPALAGLRSIPVASYYYAETEAGWVKRDRNTDDEKYVPNQYTYRIPSGFWRTYTYGHVKVDERGVLRHEPMPSDD